MVKYFTYYIYNMPLRNIIFFSLRMRPSFHIMKQLVQLVISVNWESQSGISRSKVHSLYQGAILNKFSVPSLYQVRFPENQCSNEYFLIYTHPKHALPIGSFWLLPQPICTITVPSLCLECYCSTSSPRSGSLPWTSNWWHRVLLLLIYDNPIPWNWNPEQYWRYSQTDRFFS